MSASNIRAGRAYVEVGVRDRLKSGLQKASRQLKAFAAGAAKLGGVAGAAIAGFAAVSVKAFADFGDSLNKMAARTGVSVEALSELKFAAEQGGSSIETVEKGIKRMSATIYDAAAGSKQAADALAAIGLSAQQLQGMSPEDQFTAIMEGLAGIDDASQRAAVAQKLLGRAGTELLPMVNNLEEARERARELGLVMSDEAAQKAADFSDALNEIKSAAKGVALAIGESLAETMTTVLDFGTSMITNWKETWNLVKNSALFSLSEVWEGMKHGLTVAAPAYLNWFGENWFNLWTDYSNFVLTVISNMAKGIGDIFSRIWEFITSGFEGGFGDLFSDIGEIAGRDLLEGFEATTQSLPDIPERQLKPYQQALQKEMEKSATIIAEGAAKRRQMTAGKGDAGGDITGTASEAAEAMAKVSVSAAGGFSVGAGQFAGNESIKIQQEQLNYLEMIANNTGQTNNPGGPAFGS